MELKEWLDQNKIQHHFLDTDVVEIKKLIPEGYRQVVYYVFVPRMNYENIETLFSSKFEFLFTEEERQFLQANEIENIVFEFGDKWFYSSIYKVELNILKYLGELNEQTQQALHTYLGVHGQYEICNGSRDYNDWCKKAKFLGVATLGICEEHTLAGTLNFQLACKKNGIKSILGETVKVVAEKEEFKIKLYVIDKIGWNNLLHINKEIKVKNNNSHVSYEFVLSHSEGLVCVFQTNTVLDEELIDTYREAFSDRLFYQLDFVEWSSPKYDKDYLQSILTYLKDYRGLIEPILICDSYYLDKDDAGIKKILNEIGKVGFKHQSKDQYFKSMTDVIEGALPLFEDSDKELILDQFTKSLGNLDALNKLCDFEIEVGVLHLPEYELNDFEAQLYESTEDLFWGLIGEGFDIKIKGKVKDEQTYLDRIEKEAKVILDAGLHHYFLILHDIIRWCSDNNILTGIGRGSAVGSLIAYIFNITKADPLKYGLLFERFLTESRASSGLPDIDTDISSDRRDEVKRYIEERYGVDNVVSIGTYGNFKMRAAVKDLSRVFGCDFAKTNYISSIINPECSYEELFSDAQNIAPLKHFIQDNVEIFSNIPLISLQPKTESIHAAGVVITPKIYKGENMTVFDWMPVKMMDGVLISEWEGESIEKVGFLKEDILGIKQLQKFSEILSLIESNHKVKIVLEDIDLTDRDVYNLFQEGFNEDVFQFGALGLKSYCRELKPENINDLIATVALYRPGPIENGIHKNYIKIKHGLKDIEYDHPLLEEVTKETYGLLVYQEEIMQVCVELAGFTLEESDAIRSAMGKKNMEKMESYRLQFIKGCIERSVDEFTAVKIWNKLESFAKYAFNKSHACAYAITGYCSQWLKFNFPLEFWTVALNYSDATEISRRIAELHKISSIKVLPPDINKSTNVFEHSVEDNEIYWSIGSIKFIGEKALENIITERDSNGKFFSFTDFYKRINKRSVNKRCVINLILAGCFDKIEKIESPVKRYELLNNYVSKILGEKLEDDLYKSDNIWKEYLWILKQKELTGYGYLDFKHIYNSYFLKDVSNSKNGFIESMFLQEEESRGFNKCIVGVLTEVIQKNSKRGPFGQIVVNCNDENITCLVWSEIWPDYKDLILQSVNKIICITGEIKLDTFRNSNVLQTDLKTQISVL